MSWHFISGLPHFGSTLLAALVRQNPALHANFTSRVSAMVTALLGDMIAPAVTFGLANPAMGYALRRMGAALYVAGDWQRCTMGATCQVAAEHK